MVMQMTASFLSLKNKLGFVFLAAFLSLLASPVVEAKETSTPVALSPKNVHFLGVQKVDGVCYVVLADLMLKQLYIENVKSYNKGLVEFLKKAGDLFKDEKNHEMPYHMTRKQFNEERLKNFQAEKFKLPSRVVTADHEEVLQVIIQ